MALTDLLTQIADSIRSKDGTTEPIPAMDFPKRILDIPSSGSDLPFDITAGSFTLSEDYNIYTAESPYSLTPDRSDCYVYLTTSMNFPCTIGKKYRISCTTDGLWSSNHGVVGSRLCTLWVCDGGHNYHQCFYGDNQTSGTMT